MPDDDLLDTTIDMDRHILSNHPRIRMAPVEVGDVITITARITSVHRAEHDFQGRQISQFVKVELIDIPD